MQPPGGDLLHRPGGRLHRRHLQLLLPGRSAHQRQAERRRGVLLPHRGRLPARAQRVQRLGAVRARPQLHYGRRFGRRGRVHVPSGRADWGAPHRLWAVLLLLSGQLHSRVTHPSAFSRFFPSSASSPFPSFVFPYFFPLGMFPAYFSSFFAPPRRSEQLASDGALYAPAPSRLPAQAKRVLRGGALRGQLRHVRHRGCRQRGLRDA